MVSRLNFLAKNAVSSVPLTLGKRSSRGKSNDYPAPQSPAPYRAARTGPSPRKHGPDQESCAEVHRRVAHKHDRASHATKGGLHAHGEGSEDYEEEEKEDSKSEHESFQGCEEQDRWRSRVPP